VALVTDVAGQVFSLRIMAATQAEAQHALDNFR
jgi:hypothetical protein